MKKKRIGEQSLLDFLALCDPDDVVMVVNDREIVYQGLVMFVPYTINTTEYIPTSTRVYDDVIKVNIRGRS